MMDIYRIIMVLLSWFALMIGETGLAIWIVLIAVLAEMPEKEQ